MSVADRIVVKRRRREQTLTLEDVALIQALSAERERLEAEVERISPRAIANKFGVSIGTVHRAVRGMPLEDAA